jgi:hypothetical protein
LYPAIRSDANLAGWLRAGPAKSGALCKNLKWDPILQEKLKYSTNIRYMFYYLHDNGNIKTLLFFYNKLVHSPF